MNVSRIKRIRDRLRRDVVSVIRSVRGRIRFLYVFWGLVLVVSLSFLWSAVGGEHGFLSYLKLKENLNQLKQRNRELVEQDHALQKDVHRLRSDPSFIEKVMREEFGYISNGEKVYVFPDPEPPEKGPEEVER